MARLLLQSGGKAFFDVKLAERDGDVIARTQLRMPKSPHCSGLVVYDEFVMGSGEEIVRALNGVGGVMEFCRGSMRFLLRWKAQGPATFEAQCESGSGVMVVHATPERDQARRFAERLARVMSTIKKRMLKKRRIYCDKPLHLL